MTRTRSPLRLAGACAIALSLLTAATADARLGDPDPGFGGGDGVTVLDTLTGAGLNAAAIRPDGKIVVAGHAIGPGPENQPWYTVARLTVTGELDPSFGGGDGIVQWQGNELADLYDLALEPDGDILVSGAQSPGSLETSPSPQLARVAADGGSVDVITPETLPTFQVALNAVAPLADGRIAVAGWGWPSDTAGQPRQLVAGLLSSGGVPDTGFDTDGWDLRRFADDAQALELIADAAGRLVVSGFAGTAVAGPEIAATLRYELDGTLDETFSDDGQLLVDYPAPFAGASRFMDVAERGGELFAAGRLTGGTQGVLQRITAGGVLTPGFGTTGAPNGAAVWPGRGEAVALTSTGGAVVAGRTGSDALQAAWLTPSGTPDPAAGGIRSFGIDLFADAPAVGAAIGAGDALVVAGTDTAGAAFVARFAPNAAPGAALSAPSELLAGAPAEITAAGSSDPEGEALHFAFDLDGDGSFEFDGGENPLALRSFATPGTYTVGVRVSDPRGAAATAQRSIAVVAGPAVPQPVLGKQGVARPVKGIVRFRLPGRKRFERMLELTAIPNGTEIDTRKGRVLLTVLHDASGALDGAKFYAGRFIFKQRKGATPITNLRLTDGTLAKCRKHATAHASGILAVAAKIPRSSGNRRLWGDGRGRFRTRGRYGAATVRGTKWLTDDRCDGTLVRVKRGKVDVQDVQRPRRKPIRVTAGQQTFVKKRGA